MDSFPVLGLGDRLAGVSTTVRWDSSLNPGKTPGGWVLCPLQLVLAWLHLAVDASSSALAAELGLGINVKSDAIRERLVTCKLS